MATLGQAYVQIMPSAKGISGSIANILNPEARSAGSSAGNLIGSNLVGTITKALAAIGVGKIIKDGISASLNQGADLQQNLGGTEAVFGQFASSVQSTAESAYKNMGLSASDYMATANKMGSLFQGSGVEQQKSLRMTQDAMQRAADVASVMGIDMGMAMESIAGAAKGNFTMMDNLGVAMNETTLEAYALEKGMNFKWNTASNAEKAELAMKMFMDRTSQYAGNFARESEDTFSGSLDAMKAAWSNVLGNLSLGRDLTGPLNGLAETASSFLFNNFIPMVGNIITALPGALITFFNAAKAQMLPKLQSLLDSKGIKFDLSSLSIGGLEGLGSKILASVTLALGALKGLNKLNSIKIPNPFTDLANMAKSAGTAVKSVFSGIGSSISSIFKGIGTAISTVFQGIAKAISMLNPVGIASFALGLTAVVVALTALSAVQGMVLPFLQGLSNIFIQLVGGVLQAFVSTLLALQPVMLTLSTAFSMLSPLIVAVGQAFALASPFITALGQAIVNIGTMIGAILPPIITTVGTVISGLITSMASGISIIAVAITPIISIISGAFVQIVTIVSGAIVQIIQALAPFIPSITNMVIQIAPVLAQIAEAFVSLVSQISPIIDSLSGLFDTLGNKISQILDSASGVITSFGGAVSSVLDSVAGIFDSIGNAAMNAGQGVKLMAQGVKMLVDLRLGDLVGTLAAVAGGLTGIVASGIGTAGSGLQAAGIGLMLIATAGLQAQSAMMTLPTAIAGFTTALATLPTSLTTASASIMSFSIGAVTSLVGLTTANAMLASFATMLVTIVSATGTANIGLATFNGQAVATSSALSNLGALAVSASGQIFMLGTSITTAMATASTAITSAGTRMIISMQSTMNQIVNVVRNGMTTVNIAVITGGSRMITSWQSTGNQMVTATTNMVSKIRAAFDGLESINLYAHGAAILNSFKSGMNSEWSSTQSFVTQIAEWIKKNKGPISYDRQFLVSENLKNFDKNRGFSFFFSNR